MYRTWAKPSCAATIRPPPSKAWCPAPSPTWESDRVRYTLLTNETGGIIDDLMVTNRGDHLFLVVNASRKDIDFAHIEERLAGRCELERLDDRALLALQGPHAVAVLERFAPDCGAMAFMSAADMDVGGIACTLTRSGYTGEDGFEISVPDGAAETLAAALLDQPEVKPVGLGARDSLRLEAGPVPVWQRYR